MDSKQYEAEVKMLDQLAKDLMAQGKPEDEVERYIERKMDALDKRYLSTTHNT